LQQVLAAARATFEQDAKQAGLEMAQGFKLSDGKIHSPVTITDSATGPDQVAFCYADLSKQAVVQSAATWTTTHTMVVDAATGFAIGDLVVIAKSDATTMTNPLNPGVDANIVKFDSCVAKITSLAGTTIGFQTASPWGVSNCTTPVANTMMYGFTAHAYRIDTTRPTDGPLQISYTGGLLGANEVWQDLAYGFTDIQVATDFFDNDATDLDGDGDPKRDWHADGEQNTQTAPVSVGGFNPPIQMTISLVARTDRDVEGITTASTPTLTTGNVHYNNLGDRPSVTLPSATDPALQGSRIYRYTTFRVDLRNLGVGE